MLPEFTFIKQTEVSSSWSRVSWTADESIANWISEIVAAAHIDGWFAHIKRSTSTSDAPVC
jgi:hypothetical protein